MTTTQRTEPRYLTAWPLGTPPPADAREPRPSGHGFCTARVRLTGDWHDAPRGNGPHLAQDIFAPRGTPILAPIMGRVEAAHETPNAGWNVRLRGVDTRITLAHMDGPPLVSRDEVVQVGTQLGVVGNTGRRARTTCPHLHIQASAVRSRQAINLYDDLVALMPSAAHLSPAPVGHPTASVTQLDAQDERRGGGGLLLAFTGLGLGALAIAKQWRRNR